MKILQLIAIIANMLLAPTQIVGAIVTQTILRILTTKLKIVRKKQKNATGLSSATYFQNINKQVRRMTKPIDLIELRRQIKEGIFKVYLYRHRVYIEDAENGESVMIYDLKELESR